MVLFRCFFFVCFSDISLSTFSSCPDLCSFFSSYERAEHKTIFSTVYFKFHYEYSTTVCLHGTSIREELGWVTRASPLLYRATLDICFCTIIILIKNSRWSGVLVLPAGEERRQRGLDRVVAEPRATSRQSHNCAPWGHERFFFLKKRKEPDERDREHCVMRWHCTEAGREPGRRD